MSILSGFLFGIDYSATSVLPFLRQHRAGIIAYGVAVLNAYSARAGLSHHLLVNTQDGLQSRLWCSKHFYVNLQLTTANPACCITNHVLECSLELISKPKHRNVLEGSVLVITFGGLVSQNVLEGSMEWISKPKHRT